VVYSRLRQRVCLVKQWLTLGGQLTDSTITLAAGNAGEMQIILGSVMDRDVVGMWPTQSSPRASRAAGARLTQLLGRGDGHEHSLIATANTE